MTKKKLKHYEVPAVIDAELRNWARWTWRQGRMAAADAVNASAVRPFREARRQPSV
jgi:hypothetical protein